MAPSLITRTALIDDDGSDTTGTIIDNNEIQKVYDAIDQLASGAAPYTTFEYGGNLKVDGLLTANGIAPISGNANITGNLLVTGRLQVGGTTFGQPTFPALRAGTVSPSNQQMMEVTTGDNAAWAGVRAACFISTGVANNLADLTVTGATNFAGGVSVSAGGLTVTAGGASITGNTVVNNLTVNSGPIVVSAGYINCSQYIMNTGVIYPGRADTTGQQSNWYLASHGSYGLYSNTGLFIGGNTFWCGLVAASTGFQCRPGISGAGGSTFNINWTGEVQMWIDATLIGNIQMKGSQPVTPRFNVRAANSAITAAVGDFILIDSGSFTVTLPAVVQGGIIDIKMYGAGPVTIVAPGGVYLDYPSTSYLLSVPNQSVTVVGANGNWWIR